MTSKAPFEGRGTTANLHDLIQLRHIARRAALPRNQTATNPMSGQLRSRQQGRGMDFSEVRVYQPGDDIRSIDWKVTARTLTTHTKVFQEERERPVLILLDQSPSMYFGSQVRFKSVSAVRLAATIGWAALDQGDRVGGIVFNQETHREVRPRRSRKSLLRFIHDAVEFNHHLASASNFDPKHGLPDMLTAAQRSSRHGSVVFIISDFHGVDQSLEQQIGQLGRYNEVHAICIFDPLEEKLPPPGRYTITNGQAVKEIDTSSAESRRRHQQDFSNHKELLHQLFSRHSGACTHVPVAASPEDYLSQLMSRRRL